MLYYVIVCVFIYMCIGMAVAVQSTRTETYVDSWFYGLIWPFTVFFSYFNKRPL